MFLMPTKLGFCSSEHPMSNVPEDEEGPCAYEMFWSEV